MSTYLITGSTRGLGLEMVKQLSESSDTIIATGRASSPPSDLEKVIGSSKGTVHYVQLDASNDSSVEAAVKAVSSVASGSGVDVLINNAGIAAWETEGPAHYDSLQKILETNVVGVQRVSAAFLPLLEQGRGKKIVNISSALGSVAMAQHFTSMPTPSYNVSKAALNMLTTQWHLALKDKGFTIFSVSPGWNKTDMGSQAADLEPRVGVQATLSIIKSAGHEDSGRFRNIKVDGYDHYDGKDVPN